MANPRDVREGTRALGTRQPGDSTGHGGCRSSFLGPPTRVFLSARDPKSETACGSCRSRGRQERVHRSLENRPERGFPQLPQALFFIHKVLPMFPVNFVTYVPGCTRVCLLVSFHRLFGNSDQFSLRNDHWRGSSDLFELNR